MIDLTNMTMPNTIEVAGVVYSIDTDFRVWMRFTMEYSRWYAEGRKGILDIRYLFTKELPAFECWDDYSGIFQFAFPVEVVPHSAGGGGEQVLFYEYDGDYIYAAFYQQYGIDLMTENLHWHKFKALLNGLHGTKLNEIMGYRAYTGENQKDYNAMYRKLKDAWMPPAIETEEEKKAEEEFNAFFN